MGIRKEHIVPSIDPTSGGPWKRTPACVHRPAWGLQSAAIVNGIGIASGRDTHFCRMFAQARASVASASTLGHFAIAAARRMRALHTPDQLSGLTMTPRYRPTLRRCGIVAALLVLLPRDAHAYIDPGVGSMVFQAVISGVLAAGYTLRRYRHNVRALLARWLKRR